MKRLVLISALLASAAAFAASAPTAKFGDLGMDANVVTNVDFSGLAVEETDPSFNSWTNGEAVLHGPLRFSRNLDYGSVDTMVSTNGVSAWRWYLGTGGVGVWRNYTFNWWEVLTSESDPTVPSWAKASSKPSYTASEVGALSSSTTHLSGDVPTTRKVNNKALSSDITLSASDVGAASALEVDSLSQNVSTVINYLQGDDARVVITNYDSVAEMPAASFQQKIADNGTNYWRTIWSELTRWTWLTGTYLPTNYYNKTQIGAQLDEKADRAWGFYESHTGNYAPDNYTWISSPKIAIAAGLAYQRTVTSEGAVWVLESNGLVTETGGSVTNGFFRVSDDEGNSLFEIVKGNKRTVGATAGSVTTETVMGITHLHIGYAVVSESHPTLQVCTDLSNPDWKAETSGDCIANVSWTGSSGAYVAEVWGKTAQSKMFVKAEYEIGDETYIKNAAPISAEGGILCTDGIHKVRPVYNNGTITWEVVQ